MTEHSERTVLDALRERHAPKRGGNGPEWAYMEHVRNDAGFNANRTIDAMALGLWPSRGMELHGYEVKISRADFRRELADVEKMDAFAHILDRFWIVAPAGVVPAVELPSSWGLLEVTDKGTIRQKTAAPLLTTTRADIKRSMLVPLLRAAGAALSITPNEAALIEARNKGFESGVRSAGQSADQYKSMYEAQLKETQKMREQVRAIEKALGQRLTGSYFNDAEAHLKSVAAAVKMAVAGDEAVRSAERSVRQALVTLQRTQESLASSALYITGETGVTLEGSNEPA